jgi:hypothetical protein
MAEIAGGVPLQVGRWLDQAEQAAAAFVNGFRTRGFVCEVRQAGPLVQIFGPQNALSVVLTHPLWIGDDPTFWRDEQRDAERAARRAGAAQVLFCDIWSLGRSPDRLMPQFLPR